MPGGFASGNTTLGYYLPFRLLPDHDFVNHILLETEAKPGPHAVTPLIRVRIAGYWMNSEPHANWYLHYITGMSPIVFSKSAKNIKSKNAKKSATTLNETKHDRSATSLLHLHTHVLIFYFSSCTARLFFKKNV